MYKINGYEAEKVESVTFSSLNLRENYIEEILRLNIDMLCDDEELRVFQNNVSMKRRLFILF